jgi:GNAT superfamily N-acetyltransferase
VKNLDRGTPPGFLIRHAVPEDAAELVNLVRELAVYEQLEAHARATEADFRTHLFGPDRAAEAVVAEVDGAVVGFALFFTTFSTFRGSPGLYLEDLFVRPAHRGLGIGKGLLATVAKRAVERGFPKLDWLVLNWNDPAIAFYVAAGARPFDDWTVYRLDDEPLARLAALAPESQGKTQG